MLPGRVGPFERPDANKPLGQVGRRPSSPAKLLVFTVMYIGCGIASFFVLKSPLSVILGVVFIGVGLLWFRGAATTLLRHESRQDDG